MSTPYEQAVEAAADAIAGEDGASRPGFHEVRRAHIAVDAALSHLLAPIEALLLAFGDADKTQVVSAWEVAEDLRHALASIKGQA